VAAVLFVSTTFAATPSSFAETTAAGAVYTPEPDPWFGPDKALHFGVSFALASGGYALGVSTTDERWAGVLIGGGLALGLGATKEGLDAAGLGHPSWRDMAWNVVGVALGLGVSVAFDAALRGPVPP
jgi:putative lipoprotein